MKKASAKHFIAYFFFITYFLSLILIPMIFVELYPWTHFPMFAQRNDVYSRVEVTNAQGETIPPIELGLQHQLNWNPINPTFPGVSFRKEKILGRIPPSSINQFGKKLEKSKVSRHLKSHKLLDEYLLPLQIKIKTFGPRKDGSYGLVDEVVFNVSKS